MQWFFSVLLFSLFMAADPALADDWPITPSEPIRPIEMVLIKGGCYTMGETSGDAAADGKQAHQVCVKDFYLGKYPVTQMEWTRTMGTNPSAETVCGMMCPVENVSWNEIQQFLKKLNKFSGKSYRLPTEAEWEFAARSGGRNEQWAGTSNLKELGDYAWYYNNAGMQSHPVGEKKPNGLGLYDMTGNVWQWTADRYDGGGLAGGSREGARHVSAGPQRVLRGGYWGDLPDLVRVTRRIALVPDARAAGYGFRLALTAPQSVQSAVRPVQTAAQPPQPAARPVQTAAQPPQPVQTPR